MYSIVRTHQWFGLAAPQAVFVRIHMGETDCLEKHWEAWNAEHDGFFRKDEVIESGIVSMKEAVAAIRKYC